MNLGGRVDCSASKPPTRYTQAIRNHMRANVSALLLDTGGVCKCGEVVDHAETCSRMLRIQPAIIAKHCSEMNEEPQEHQRQSTPTGKRYGGRVDIHGTAVATSWTSA